MGTRVNDQYEFSWDGRCWQLDEWYEGEKVDKETNEKVKVWRKKEPRYYISLHQICMAIVERTAGAAANEGRSIVEAVQKAKNELLAAISGGGPGIEKHANLE